jgi:hypothetical protein
MATSRLLSTNSQPAQGGRRHERSNQRRLVRLDASLMYTAQTSRFNEQVALHVLLEAKADPNKPVILAWEKMNTNSAEY